MNLFNQRRRTSFLKAPGCRERKQKSREIGDRSRRGFVFLVGAAHDGPRIQASHSSTVVRMTGIALG
jgi:hypothetical protein